VTKWKSAVINLEARKNKWENLDSQRTMSFQESLMPLKRATGTAVFLRHDKHRYLITARHMLFDADAILQKKKYNQYDSINDPFSIYLNIMQIQSSEETEEAAKIPNIGLGLLGVPSYRESNYIYSTPDMDLAIISLDGNTRYSMFADILEKKGYKPISLTDIDTTSLNYGDQIVCVGYPSVSFGGEKTIDSTMLSYYSNYVSNPAFTFGHVANPSIHNYFFLSDLTISPGNSGGPIIKEGKLVGIVSLQGNLNVQDKNGNNYMDAFYRFPYGFAIKSAHIIPLLNELIAKDEANEKTKSEK